MVPNRAIVSITRKLPKLRGKPQIYYGVVELADSGYTQVEIALPYGVKDFPACPYMVMVDCDNTYCERRKGKWPLLTITEWFDMEHMYM